MCLCDLITLIYVSGTHTAEEGEIIKLTQRLIISIANRDFKTYRLVLRSIYSEVPKVVKA